MAELNTIARPYAQAAFDIARADKSFDDWSQALDVLAVVVADERVADIINNPKVAVTNRESFLLDFCGKSTAADKIKNLVKIMSLNKRLSVLANVAEIFKSLRAEVEQIREAEVVTANKITSKVKDSLQKALEKRFSCKVTLNCRVDKTVIGGGIVRVDDWVIDGTVVSQLKRLETVLAN